MSTEPSISNGALQRVRRLCAGDDEYALTDAIDRLVERHPDNPQVGELLLEIANDARPWIRGLAIHALRLYPSMIEQSLPVFVAGLNDENGSYGGGWGESVQAWVIESLKDLGPVAKPIVPELEKALVRWLNEQSDGVADTIEALLKFVGPEHVTELVFQDLTESGHSNENATHLLLGWLPADVRYPEFLLKHSNSSVVTAVMEKALNRWLWKERDDVALVMGALVARTGRESATRQVIGMLGEMGFNPEESEQLIASWLPPAP